MNFDPDSWGPGLWRFLHCATLSYPDNPTTDDMENMYSLFTSLESTLPCSECRAHYSDHILRSPLTVRILSSRRRLVRWLIDIHNEVNQTLGKPTLSYKKAIKIYLKE